MARASWSLVSQQPGHFFSPLWPFGCQKCAVKAFMTHVDWASYTHDPIMTTTARNHPIETTWKRAFKKTNKKRQPNWTDSKKSPNSSYGIYRYSNHQKSSVHNHLKSDTKISKIHRDANQISTTARYSNLQKHLHKTIKNQLLKYLKPTDTQIHRLLHHTLLPRCHPRATTHPDSAVGSKPARPGIRHGADGSPGFTS